MSDLAAYLLLFVAGAVAGTINVLAGGGSFLTLPLLIFLGLPPTVANGTNRIAILVQNVGAVWSFNRHGVMDWSWIRKAALPALAGAGLGTWAAIRIGDASFQRVLATLMIVFAVVILLDPLRNRIQRVTGAGVDPARQSGAQPRVSGVGFSILFFGVGVYGGFVQAGVGLLHPRHRDAGGLRPREGECPQGARGPRVHPLALVLFAMAGKVDWGMGIALAGGNLLGGLAGTHLTVLKGHAWVKRVVVVMIVVFALKLWLAP